VQIGAELLCKCAKVRLNFQVTGLGRREPGSGVQVRVQVRVLNFTPHPHLTLITRTRDLMAETWDPKLFLGRADHPWSAAVEQGCSTLPDTVMS
jgi:hypothetical protein